MSSFSNADFDVVIRGGGPLACAIARDAVGRGLRVLLSTDDDFGGDLRQHIVSCGLSLLPDYDDAQHDEATVMQRICPQIKTKLKPTAPDNRIRFFGPKETVKPNLPCGSVANRFALLNARDATERGARLYSNSTLDVQKQSDTSWTATVSTLNGDPITTVNARVYIDTLPKLQDAKPRFARVATFKRASDVDDFARTRGDSVHFAFEAVGNATDVGLITPHDPSEQDLIEMAHRMGIHGTPIWVSDSFSPKLEQAKLSISSAPTQFNIADTAPSGWRKLAEDVVAEIAPFAQMIGKRWTAFAKLPGGDFEPALRETLLADLQKTHPNIDTDAMDRMFSNYGTECYEILASTDDLGHHFGAGLFEAEVNWLVSQEWANTANDVLWRRTLLGMHFTDAQTEGLNKWMAQRQ
ncbi:glycerol-3-phosphate dehydrogenase C-terminal domain-containing protein [Amylibacter sp. IMCC11727]|uniref:glycerol-3-phosphate dehydrogenase C-terminal domain-containing protein n=1 Tax=Amylibacter sp. IMCC11727 TaxID=3039851 RepID=UPI00244E57B6|nr:glycerol-3-phosphate dehydrogenase C-terminal domain-containing protein [Amylibacter sp. IMCC11727]WGI21965.1 glycerol-3-phosphate dehydrogenase C-terminal domain-containing protein [Amylibacter sp. IMCC11727]